MRLLNGLVFGTGIGLITAGAFGLAYENTTTVYILGILLLLTEAGRLLTRSFRQT